MKRDQGSVLVGLLWCLALLLVMVVGVLHTATLDLRVAKNHGDKIQARYLALAGLEKTKALLYHEAWDRRRSRVSHSGKLYNAPEHFRDVPLGRGFFRVIREARSNEPRGLVYGITDEESRLDINRASLQELTKLPEITPEEAAAILDYRDTDNEVTQGGAEAEQYAELQPPYEPHNGPFRTMREVLMVRGLDPATFLGEDANLNGLLDPEEKDGRRSDPPDNGDSHLDAGWSEWVSLESQVRNVNAAGESRVNIQEADESTLAKVPGLSEDLARAIVEYRNQNRFETLADLLEVTAPNPRNRAQPSNRSASPGNNPNRPPGGQASPAFNAPANPGPGGGGESLISETLFMDIADDLTVETEMDLPGRVNINTAGLDVLICLPGLTRELAQNIINYRASSGFFSNIAWLLKVPDMNREIFKQLAPRVTV